MAQTIVDENRVYSFSLYPVANMNFFEHVQNVCSLQMSARKKTVVHVFLQSKYSAETIFCILDYHE